METDQQPKDKQPKDDLDKPRGTPYAQMSSSKKVLFIAKLALCIITFGMAFPNVMSD
ncbi:MAG: hypothetical protein ACM30H_12750 [Clostridia bacterium]